MEGMSTQELLNGQDLSTANVDDLLAAMKQEELAAEPAPEPEPPKPKRGTKKAEPEPIADLPDLESILEQTAKAEGPGDKPVSIWDEVNETLKNEGGDTQS